MTPALQQRLYGYLFNILVLMLVGTAGFMVVERWSFLDALYMTVTTLTTVGYGEVHDLSDAGRIYAIVLILAGVGVVLYILSSMVEIFVEANPPAKIRRNQMRKMIAKMSGHYILCGFGRTGQEVVDQFLHGGIPFVVIDSEPAAVKRAEEAGLVAIDGDASDDAVLLEAGVDRARGIVCALNDDLANTYIALSAKQLNESIVVVSRSSNPGSEEKMRRAGANLVISPYAICGRRMATAVTHPLVTEFLDVVMHTPAYDLRMEQATIMPTSSLIGKTLRDANIKQSTGAMILAVSQSGKLITNPSPDLVFSGGNELIALGAEEELARLSELAGARKD